MARLTLQKTLQRIMLLIRSGYPVLYIVTHEEFRILDFLSRIVNVIRYLDSKNRSKNLIRWYNGVGFEMLNAFNPVEGEINQEEINWLRMPGIPSGNSADYWEHVANRNSNDALKFVRDAGVNDVKMRDSVVVFYDIHQELINVNGLNGQLVRPLRNTADSLRKYYENNRADSKHYKTLIIVAPGVSQISMELERDIIKIDFPLPETDELQKELEAMITGGQLGFPDAINQKEIESVCGTIASEDQYKKQLKDLIAGAGRGLTLDHYKLGLNSFAVHGQMLRKELIDNMLDLKAKTINNDALQYTPNVEINLGGLEEITRWIRLRKGPATSETIRNKYNLPKPKGVLLCGASGGGKSQLAKLIAKEFSLALLRLDIGSLFGAYVGVSEERTRQVLQLAEVLSPVVLWVDEIDKAFVGANGGGGDNGVSTRVLGYFLTWLSEKQDDVFVVATANDFNSLLEKFPEFGRKGRFDEIFWVGLPDKAARKKIFEIYLEKYIGKDLVVDENEIRSIYVKNNIDEAGEVINTPDPLYSLLSDDVISAGMTGAEIEYAVNEALYRAYESREQFSATIIADTVIAAKDKALYRIGSKDKVALDNLETTALKGKKWPNAG